VARPVFVTASAADALAYTGPCQLAGFSIRETGATNPATIVLRDGITVAGPIVVEDRALAGTARAQVLPNIEFTTGIFVDRSETGTSELVLYLTS
jgi:hypothetical protein